MKYSKYTFIKQWKKENAKILKASYPDVSKKEINEFLDKIIEENLYNPKCVIDNDYIGVQMKSTLLDVIEWIKATKPICAGFGVFFKNQHEVNNPLAQMIMKFLTSRKAFKGQLKFHDPRSYEYKTLDRKQNSEKVNTNSIYGCLGMVASFLYNKYTAPSVTSSGQSLISTTQQAFEAFMTNNVKFNSISECMTFINNIIDEKYHHDTEFLENKSIDDVFVRLMKMFYDYNDSYTDVIYNYLWSLSQEELNKIYYKNNIYEFSSLPKIKDILSNIFIHTKDFKDPNNVPKESEEYLAELWDYYKDFVLYNHSPFERIQRLKNDKRQTTIAIDTDSNIVNVGKWVEFLFDEVITHCDISIDSQEEEDRLRFICVNTAAYCITYMIKTVLNKYTKDANIPKDYRSYINMKNEFYFPRFIATSKKKRYMASIRLREGSEIYPEKMEVKGHDFKKSTVTEDTEKRFTNISRDKLLLSKDIDISDVLYELEQFEDDIVNSLSSREKTYVTPTSVKELEAYTFPLRMQGVRGIIAWNYIYPDAVINLPAKVDIIKLTLTTESEFERLKRLSPEIYERVKANILDNPNKDIASKGLEILAIPKGMEQLPEWIVPFIDYETITFNILRKYYSVLESLGADIIEGNSKRDYFSNMINI